MSNDRIPNDVQAADDAGEGHVPDSGVPDADGALDSGGTLLGVAPLRADVLPVADGPGARSGETLIGTPVIGAPHGGSFSLGAFSLGSPSFRDATVPSRPDAPQPGETMIAVAPVSPHPDPAFLDSAYSADVHPAYPRTFGDSAPEAGGTMIGIAPLGRVESSSPASAIHSNSGASASEPGGTMIGIAPIGRDADSVFGAGVPASVPADVDGSGGTMIGIAPVHASAGASAAAAGIPAMRRVGPPAAYEILDHIGGGEFGQVFRARPRPLGEQAGGIEGAEAEVALRLIRPELSDDAQAMAVLRDVVALAQTARHPHLGRLLGLDESASPTLVLELVRGRKLLDLMGHRGRAPAAAVVDLGLRLCSALAVAHAAGLAHGRIHAGNVVLEAQTGRWVLLDLGHAYLTQDLEPLHDLYALAALLYEMATGRQPFAEGESEAPDPRTFAPELPDAVAELLLRSLSPDPDRWYGSALELSQALAASKRHG